jgi:hypothetical protein
VIASPYVIPPKTENIASSGPFRAGERPARTASKSSQESGRVNICQQEHKFWHVRTEISIGWTKLRGFSVAVVLVKLDALAARAISHSLVEISALLADPDRWNNARKAMLAITDVPAFFSLFRHVSFTARSGAVNSPRRLIQGASAC